MKDIKATLAFLRQEEEKIKKKYQSVKSKKDSEILLRNNKGSHEKTDSIGLLRERLKGKTIKVNLHKAINTPRYELELPGFFEDLTSSGKAFYKETIFPLNYRHGESFLYEAFETPGDVLHLIGNSNIDIKKSLFLDTETTGLMGGAGTFPFLIGLGFFKGEHFIIRQYFSPDYQYEEANLIRVRSFMEEYPNFITFNGKVFDLPLIETRMILNRIRPINEGFLHMDLLFFARRLWKRRIESCKLTSLETNVLKFFRQGDVSGFLIPALYNDYLKTKDFSKIEKIFEHNIYDIITMVALIPRIWAHLQCADEGQLCFLDYMSLGSFYQKKNDLDKALYYFNKATSLAVDITDKIEVRMNKAKIYKKMKVLDKAVPLWEEVTSITEFDIKAHIELAKYYEHKLKDYSKAINIVNEALEINNNKRRLGLWKSFYEEHDKLLYRLKRLEKKKTKG